MNFADGIPPLSRGSAPSNRADRRPPLAHADLMARPVVVCSLRQPGLAQTLCPPGEILRSADGAQIPEIGNTESGLELAQACHGFLRLRQPPGERATCRDHGGRDEMVWLLPRRCFRP